MPIRVNDNDVLLGRGGRNHEHEGNEQLRRIAHSRVREYERASKKQKAVISRGESVAYWKTSLVPDKLVTYLLPTLFISRDPAADTEDGAPGPFPHKELFDI